MSHRTLNDTAAQVLAALMRLHDLTDGAVAKAIGKDRTWIEARRNGRSRITLHDLEQLAEVLGLPPTVFFMEPADAVRFSLDNPSDQGIRSTIWTKDVDQVVRQLALDFPAPEAIAA